MSACVAFPRFRKKFAWSCAIWALPILSPFAPQLSSSFPAILPGGFLKRQPPERPDGFFCQRWARVSFVLRDAAPGEVSLFFRWSVALVMAQSGLFLKMLSR